MAVNNFRLSVYGQAIIWMGPDGYSIFDPKNGLLVRGVCKYYFQRRIVSGCIGPWVGVDYDVLRQLRAVRVRPESIREHDFV